MRHLLPPRHVVAACPVEEGDGFSFAVGFIIEINAVE
jgi:hypothetical protein